MGKLRHWKNLDFTNEWTYKKPEFKKNEQFGSHDEKKSLVYCEFKAIDIGTR